jgi:uncharacterized protein YgbK (DUF1537 family)
MPILLGAIADDFTGATNLANTLVKRGMRAVQTIDVPTGDLDLGDAEAVVVALKSKTAQGARQSFFKYCSTFDSTPEGNIDPVADALLEALETDFAIVCPAFPANARTVYQGHLFPGDQLLCESSMKDHPLTPMPDSSLVRLMSAQTRRRVGLVPHGIVASGVQETAAAFRALRAAGLSYGVVDALSDGDLETIGAAAAAHGLITGGSGVATGLPTNLRREGLLGGTAEPGVPDIEGRAVVLAGSCSPATRAQIARVRQTWPLRKLDAHGIAAGRPVVEDILAWASAQPESAPILVYSSADPDEVAAIQAEYGRERAGTMIEQALGRIARGLVTHGARRIVVAGGETAGTLVSALGVRGLRIGVEIDPGVPWTETLDEPRLALALKSGNFGAKDFFTKALDMLP